MPHGCEMIGQARARKPEGPMITNRAHLQDDYHPPVLSLWRIFFTTRPSIVARTSSQGIVAHKLDGDHCPGVNGLKFQTVATPLNITLGLLRSTILSKKKTSYRVLLSIVSLCKKVRRLKQVTQPIIFPGRISFTMWIYRRAGPTRSRRMLRP